MDLNSTSDTGTSAIDGFTMNNNADASSTLLFDITQIEPGALVELFPVFSRVRQMRTWGGIVDTCPDASPIVSKTPVEGLYFNSGWGTGGFKATPGSGWTFAHTIARDDPHQINAPFSLDRFTTGALINEHGAAAVAH